MERQKVKGKGERYRQTEIGRAWSRDTGRDRKTKEGEKDTETGRACSRETGRDRKTREREKDTDRDRESM